MTVPGSNFFSTLTSAVEVALTDPDGYATLVRGTGAAPATASTFAHGCLYIQKDSGTGNPAIYQNVGSVAVPSWSLLSVGGGAPSLTSAHLFVGNAGNVATDVAITGAVSITNAGVTSLSLADGTIYVGDGTGTAVGRTILGDLAVSNAGVATVATSAITKTKLAVGVRPESMAIAAGSFTTVAGSATQTIADASIAGTDIAVVVMYQRGAAPVTILESATIAGGISVLMSGDPGNDHRLSYVVFRATT